MAHASHANYPFSNNPRNRAFPTTTHSPCSATTTRTLYKQTNPMPTRAIEAIFYTRFHHEKGIRPASPSMTNTNTSIRLTRPPPSSPPQHNPRQNLLLHALPLLLDNVLPHTLPTLLRPAPHFRRQPPPHHWISCMYTRREILA
jgi:hypothetical protein